MAATGQHFIPGATRPNRLQALIAALKQQSWPTYAAYTLFTVTLLTSAFARAIAGLKPGEILLGLVVLALVVRRVVRRDFSFVTTPVDLGFILLIVAGTWLPLIAAEVRGVYLTKEIATALAGPLEYYLWYRAILEALPLPSRSPTMLKVILIVNTIISGIGVLQIFRFPGVQKFLVAVYPTYETLESQLVHRATSLVGGWEILAAIAAFTLLLINQLQTTEGAVRKLGSRWNVWLTVMLGINVVGLLATLSFAGLIGLAVGYLIAWGLNGKLARMTRVALIIGAVGLIALSPFVLQRFAFQFNRPGASHGLVPNTWATRGYHWSVVISVVFIDIPTALFGVQPSFRYPVLDFGSTESLYLLLLYRGGIIYVAAFLAFIVLVVRHLWKVRQTVSGFNRQIVLAVLTVLIVNFVIDILDAHFFSAGESQLLLTLLAIGVGTGMRTDQRLEPTPAPPDEDEEQSTQVRSSVRVSSVSLQRAIMAVGVVALVGLLVTAGLGINNDRHRTPPPGVLKVSYYDAAAPVSQENQLLGTPTWELDAGADTSYIQGYAGQVSALPGTTVPLYISAQGTVPYNIDVYRVGWYSGLGGRLMKSVRHLTSQPQGYWTAQAGLQGCITCTIDPKTHLIAANWSASYALSIDPNWPSGVYLIKLSTLNQSPRGESYIPLVVRAQTVKPATVLANLPVNTYQAGNLWGGYDLNGTGALSSDTGSTPDRATKVSFDRPYAAGAGTGDLLSWDLHIIRFLERGGMNVSYTTNIDVAEHPDELTNHAIFLSMGHDAYWTKTMRDGIETARDSKVNLMFLGANDAYWQARLEPNAHQQADRTLVCYKVQTAPSTDPSARLTADPAYPAQKDQVTARWRDPVINRPENSLLGLMYASYFPTTHLGDYLPDWVARSGDVDPLLAVANVSPSQHIPGGVLGDTFDSVGTNGLTPRNLTLLASSPVVDYRNELRIANTAYYQAQSGAYVFDAGTLWWAFALDEYSPRGAGQPNLKHGDQRIVVVTTYMLFQMFNAAHVPAPVIPPVPQS